MGINSNGFNFVIENAGGSTTIIKGFEAIIFMISICVLVGFLIYSITSKTRIHTLHKLYIFMSLAFVVWLSAMVVMWFVGRSDIVKVGNENILWILDSLTYIGVSFLPVFEFLIVIAITSKTDDMSSAWYWVFALPVLTNILVWTNKYHHLIYHEFSVSRNDLELGTYVMIAGVLNYVLLVIADVLLFRNAVKKKDKLFWQQTVMLFIGTLVTLIVSMIATFGGNLTIAATPLSFTVFLICNYIAIYKLHILDLVPIATKHVLDYISDGYLILNEDKLVVDDNRPFRNGVGKLLGVSIGKYFNDCQPLDVNQGMAAKKMLSGQIEQCRRTHSQLSYEQYFIVNDEVDNIGKKQFYIIDITPMLIQEKLIGFAIVFKDITQVRKSLEQVQSSKVRLMEQERLAMLGQMVGGIAHNLKTPIMAIAGCTSSVETLIQEITESIGDPDVTEEDYNEIAGEIYDWIGKIRSSCSYMSDIITTVKGQAQIANANDKIEFSIEEVIKRTQLLMRHELSNNGVTLELITDFDPRLMLVGDINSLIQVLNNLISNAIYAENESDEKKVYFTVRQSQNTITMSVRDTGKGVDPSVRDKLFNEMVTTKGTHGTGLGLYISYTTIRGKFDGKMWIKDAEPHGAIFGFDIPLIVNRDTEPDEDTDDTEANEESAPSEETENQ